MLNNDKAKLVQYINLLKRRLDHLKRQTIGYASESESVFDEAQESQLENIIEELEELLKENKDLNKFKLIELLEQSNSDDIEYYMGHVGMERISDCEEKIPHMISELQDVVDRLVKAHRETKNLKYRAQYKDLHKAVQDLDNARKILTDFSKEYWKENTNED